MMSTAGAVFFGILPCFLYFGAFLDYVSGFGVGFFRKPALLLHFGSLF